MKLEVLTVVSAQIRNPGSQISLDPGSRRRVLDDKGWFRARRTHQMLSASLGMTLASGMLGKLAAVLLIPMLLLQPLLPVYAADASVTGDASSTSTGADAPATPTPDSAPTADAAPTDAVAPASDTPPVDTVAPPAETPSDIPTPASSSDATTSTPDETVAPSPESTPASVPEATSSNLTSTPDATSTSANEGTPAGDAETTSIDSTATTDTEATTSENVSDTATTSEEATSEEVVAPETPVDDAAVKAAQEEAARQAEEAKQAAARAAMRKDVEAEFTKGCLTLDGVGYYCLKDLDLAAHKTLTPSRSVTGVSVAADPAGGGKEIFITRGQETVQLTHNTWEDAFPAMDVTGKSVVWQGMVEGRWQIFVADVSSTTPTITQITHGKESNFNARVDGEGVVWQGWVNGNWEIFLAERLASDQYYQERPVTPDDPTGGLPNENRMLGIDGTWKVTRLTNNDTHDMFPSIAGGLITWQSYQDGAWNVYAYNMKTGGVTQLSQGGVKSENPHFAITWDEHDDTGGVRMVGYDIASGKTIDLTNEARNTPSGTAPYHPVPTPVSQPNQAALPPVATSSGTSTSARPDGDGSDGGANPVGT